MLRTIAAGLFKIACDLRWMNSGPRAGLAEIRLPELQPGSSIMPGKVNPVIPEAVCQVAAQVMGNDAAIAFGGAAGNFELNVMMPMMARNVLESLRLLANVSRVFADRCVAGHRGGRTPQPGERGVLPGDRHAPHPLHRLRGGRLGRQAAPSPSAGPSARSSSTRGYVDRGLLTLEQLDAALDVLAATRPPGA